MIMKLKVQDLYNLNEGLKELLEKEIPTTSAFVVQRNYKKIAEELETSDKVRRQMVEKYKESDNKDGTVQIKKDKVFIFNDEYKELMNQEIDVDLKQLDLSHLGDTMKPKTIALLEKIIDDGFNEGNNAPQINNSVEDAQYQEVE